MFYYKTTFSKKAVFSEKTAENPFVEGMTILKGGGSLATKINITFFVCIEVLNIFHTIIFSKKGIFPK